ncbi:hypothetical protein SUGI_0790370 [Cryptomeria japonica]|nr:hypothetical protein SUGI_0790370 [Cryptomeria japonica]
MVDFCASALEAVKYQLILLFSWFYPRTKIGQIRQGLSHFMQRIDCSHRVRAEVEISVFTAGVVVHVWPADLPYLSSLKGYDFVEGVVQKI